MISVPLSLGLQFQCTLTFLDISDNDFGDVGCIALAKALRRNRTLTALKFDGNGIQIEGFKAIKGCLIGNQKLVDVPFPHRDIEVRSTNNQDASTSSNIQFYPFYGHSSTAKIFMKLLYLVIVNWVLPEGREVKRLCVHWACTGMPSGSRETVSEFTGE